MGDKKLFLVIVSFIFLINFISAAPQITIHSPQNISYDETQILVDVTSNELVDFYTLNKRTGEKEILKTDTTEFQTYLYAKKGGYDFEIWAGNAEGIDNEIVSFEITQHNPVEITSCGSLYSTDTEYILMNDISSTSTRCMRMNFLRNVTFDLNEHTINAGIASGLEALYSSDIEVFNGKIKGSNAPTVGFRPYVLNIEGSKLYFHDLYVGGHVAAQIGGLESVIFSNITFNNSVGFWTDYPIAETHIINSTFLWNGVNPAVGIPPTAFWDRSSHSSFFLENTTLEFPNYNLYLEGTFTDFYLRNSNIDMSKIYYPDWVADTRFFKQHLIVVDVGDQFNETGSGVIEILDDGTLPRRTGIDSMTETLANPTAQFLVATDENGKTNFWLTEKLTLARSSSPPAITEYDFSEYVVTARTWNNSVSQPVNLTNHNSTIPLNFTLEIETGEELPTCTIAQMLDLNNDGEVNVQDAVMILRLVTGKPVSVEETNKGCEGINLIPL